MISRKGNVICKAVDEMGFTTMADFVHEAVSTEARLVVTDHGMGVAPEQREKIFEPFARGVSVDHYGGLGLGLFLVRTIVTRLHGTVRVEPEPGRGSRFVIELPQARES